MSTTPDNFTFSPEVADYPAEAALRRYPVARIADGTDRDAAIRAAYADGLAAGLSAATP